MADSEETDLRELRARIARGDRAAMKAFYERTSAKVYGLVHALLRDEVSTRACCRAIYADIWRKPMNGSDVLQELLKSARREALRLTSSQAQASPAMRPNATARAASPFGELTEDERSLLLDAYMHGLSLDDLARRHGLTSDVAASRLARSLAKISEADQ